MYKVIEDFTDLQDKMHTYSVGMTYPRNGYIPTEKRIAELSGKGNKLGRAVIEAVNDETEDDTEEEVYTSEEKVEIPEEKPRKRRRRE